MMCIISWHLCEDLANIALNTLPFADLLLRTPNRINRLFFRHTRECAPNHIGFI